MPGTEDLEKRQWVGAPVRHVEDPRFITGGANYTDDVKLPGVLHVAFVRSTEAHANIKSVDVAPALEIPGVVAAFTGADLADEVLPITAPCSYPTYQQTGQEALATKKVHMVGEAVAAIVAEDRYTAEDGVDAVEVAYEPLQAITDVHEAMAEGAPAIHEEAPDNIHVWFHRVTGDPDKAFAEADFEVELELNTQRYAAVCLEPRAVTARYDEALDELTVWMSSQTPHPHRSALAEFQDMPEHRIRVITPAVGGGFGQKHLLHAEDLVIAALARIVGQPVKWTSDRSEDLQVSMHAREQLHKIKAAVRNDGKVLAIKAEIYADNGAFSPWPVSAALDCGQASDNVTGPYDIQNYERRAYAVITNKAPVGPYRGVGRPHACLDHERLMDEVARRTGLDPADVRQKNFIREFPYVTASDFHLESGNYPGNLDLALDNYRYAEKRSEHAELVKQGVYRGTGMAFFVEQSSHGKSEWERKGVMIAAGYDTADIRIEPDGKVRLAVGLHNHGQGQETTMAQIAADQLGVSPDDVRVVFGDTDHAYGFGSYSSRGTVYCGGATILAARDVREKARTIAAFTLEASTEDVELVDGHFSVKGAPTKSMSWAEVSKLASHRPAKLPPGVDPGLDSMHKYMANEWGTFASAAHVVEVEVDIETGQVKILNYVIAEDAGTIVNPLGVEAQIQGGIGQGIGGTLLEDMRYDGSGQLVAGTFMDYLLPGFTDVPDVEVYHQETPSPINVGGFKGMGEGGCINVAPAIANAIIDAVSPLGEISINRTPIKPENVLAEIDRVHANGR